MAESHTLKLGFRGLWFPIRVDEPEGSFAGRSG